MRRGRLRYDALDGVRWAVCGVLCAVGTTPRGLSMLDTTLWTAGRRRNRCAHTHIQACTRPRLKAAPGVDVLIKVRHADPGSEKGKEADAEAEAEAEA